MNRVLHGLLGEKKLGGDFLARHAAFNLWGNRCTHRVGPTCRRVRLVAPTCSATRNNRRTRGRIGPEAMRLCPLDKGRLRILLGRRLHLRLQPTPTHPVVFAIQAHASATVSASSRSSRHQPSISSCSDSTSLVAQTSRSEMILCMGVASKGASLPGVGNRSGMDEICADIIRPFRLRGNWPVRSDDQHER